MFNSLPYFCVGCECFPGVGESEWMFKTTINVTEEELAAEHVDLVFDGLDTFAIIKLVCWTTRKAISSKENLPFVSTEW